MYPRKTRRKFSTEEKIRIVLEGVRGEESIVSLCRREGIVANLYYRWSKENARCKEVVAETVLENRLFQKSVMGSGSPEGEA